MSGIFGSLFGKRKASQPADTSGRAAPSSSRTGPGPSSWTGPPPRDPKHWRGPHNRTRSRVRAHPLSASRIYITEGPGAHRFGGVEGERMRSLGGSNFWAHCGQRQSLASVEALM